MSSQSSGGRRRSNNVRQYSAEDQALNMISKEAEARLAAKRAARAEAREIRMKEIEKQHKESESKQDRIYELTNEHAVAKNRQLSGSRSGSRRGSTESNDSETKDVDLKAEMRELEDKYKAAMMTSAQLDNEKQSLVYQVELLKDQLEEQDEGYTEMQREFKDKCREYDFQKRDLQKLEHELSILKQQLEIKDRLIEESGFVIVANAKGEPVLEKQSSERSSNGPLPSGAVLVSTETRDFLEKAGGSTLGTAVSAHPTNTLNVGSKVEPVASQTVSSSSVDASGGTGDKDEVDSAAKTDEKEIGRDRAGVETMHDKSSVSTNLDQQCEHDLSVQPSDGDSGDGISMETSMKVPRDDSGITVDEASNMGDKGDAGVSGEIPSVTVTKSEGHEESDEGDEFYDAISTPSPFGKPGSFELQAEGNHNNSSPEGTSVDDSKIEIRCGTGTTIKERDSVIVEDATVTESCTDEKEDIPSPGLENEGKEFVEEKDIMAEESKELEGESSVDGPLQESVSDEQEHLAGKEEKKKENEDAKIHEIESQETAEEVEKEENVVEVNVNKTEGSVKEDAEETKDDTSVEVEGKKDDDASEVSKSSEHIAEDVVSHKDESNFEDKVGKEISVSEMDENLDTISAQETVEDQNTKEPDAVVEGGESIEMDKESNEATSHLETITKNESEKQESEVTESIEQMELQDQEKTNTTERDGSEGKTDDNMQGLYTDSKGENEAVEENEVGEATTDEAKCEQEEQETGSLSPLHQDKSKMMMRTSSMGGSDASDGAAPDDYDLDDIDDILDVEPTHGEEGAIKEAQERHEEAAAVDQVTEISEAETAPQVKGKKGKKSGKDKDKEKTSKDKSSKSSDSGKHKGHKESEKEKEKASKGAEGGKKEKKSSHKDKDKSEASSKSEAKLGKGESQASLEPDDLEGALDKQMAEADKSSHHKKAGKFNLFKKVFK